MVAPIPSHPKLSCFQRLFLCTKRESHDVNVSIGGAAAPAHGNPSPPSRFPNKCFVVCCSNVSQPSRPSPPLPHARPTVADLVLPPLALPRHFPTIIHSNNETEPFQEQKLLDNLIEQGRDPADAKHILTKVVAKLDQEPCEQLTTEELGRILQHAASAVSAMSAPAGPAVADNPLPSHVRSGIPHVVASAAARLQGAPQPPADITHAPSAAAAIEFPPTPADHEQEIIAHVNRIVILHHRHPEERFNLSLFTKKIEEKFQFAEAPAHQLALQVAQILYDKKTFSLSATELEEITMSAIKHYASPSSSPESPAAATAEVLDDEAKPRKSLSVSTLNVAGAAGPAEN